MCTPRSLRNAEPGRTSKDLGINLVSVLPGAMLGPGFTRLTPALEIVPGAIADEYPMVPPIDFASTDVRDVAHAQILLFDPQFGGCYIVAGPTLGFGAVLEEITNCDQTP
jgi:dihydroflavonol-4-reductase